MFKGIDLNSDTATRPTAAMKQAMFEAELGDEQKGEDPTTRKLEEKIAAMLGLEASMFFPSATMANEIAIKLQCEPGDELIAAENCHLFFAEAGGPAVHSGVQARPIPGTSGLFNADDLRAHFRWNRGPHYPVSRLLSIENTTNMGGGLAWNLGTLNAVLDAAKELGLKTHLDGSRLFNAVVKTGCTPRQLASRFDTVTICLSKGLGCASGALLAFASEQRVKVRRLKQLFGGALRQSGILAAGGIYALDHHIERLAEDHANARYLAERLAADVPKAKVETSAPSTNMVFFSWHSEKIPPRLLNETCIKEGLRFSQVGENRFRAVTHLDIRRTDIERAIQMLQGLR